MINWDNFELFFNTGIPPKILFSSLIITGFVIIAGILLSYIKEKKRFILWVALIEYLFIVISSTIIFRGVIKSNFEKLQLTPFWTYKSVIAHTPGVSVWDIVLNVVLFLPLGFLVKLIYPNQKLLYFLGIAVGCSVLIEINQFIFDKGIAQFDDVMHNVIGAIIGYGIAWGFIKICSTSS